MKWLLKWAGWQAYAVFAAAIAVVLMAWMVQVSGLKAEISDAKAATSAAERKLSERIAAEATAVATAVTEAREEESVKLNNQQVKYVALLKTNDANKLALSDARKRLYYLARADTPASAGGQDKPDGPQATGPTAGTGEDGLRPEDRALIGDLLQIAGEAKQIAEERNFLASEYIAQCERQP